MWVNRWAQHRLDILFAGRDVARWVSQPNTVAWDMATRCGRYLLGKQRVVRRFVTLLSSGHHHVDSRRRPCRVLEDGRFAAYHGKHRRRRRCSRGRPESQKFYAVVRGTATSLRLWSSAREDMRSRLHLKRIRYLGTWIVPSTGVQRNIDTWTHRGRGCRELFHRRRATIRKIPGTSNEADLLTKSADGKEKQRQRAKHNVYHYTQGG